MVSKNPGRLMASESAEALGVFCKTAQANVSGAINPPKVIYTVARGSSDAAANILSYEFMRELRVPMTSLPPSVFSLGDGVALQDACVLMISQSGASDDLVRSARGAKSEGAQVLAITNKPDSAVERQADMTIPINAGDELAVPATKTVIGSVAAGLAVLGAMKPSFAKQVAQSADVLAKAPVQHPDAAAIQSSLLRARHVYVIGRDTGYGAAHEVALKLKECCAIHAEAYSSSEVLHGPLQLATNPLLVLMLDTGDEIIQDSLDQAEARFRGTECDVHRVRTSDLGVDGLVPGAAAAFLLAVMYPIILNTSLALGLDPDAPQTLSKVTQTT